MPQSRGTLILLTAWAWAGCVPSHPTPPRASVVEVSPQDRAERNANDAQVDPHPRTPTAQKPSGYDDFLQLDAHLMGTAFRLTIDEDAEVKGLVDAGRKAFEEVARIEQLMSEWRQNSEISQVNSAAGRKAVKVSPETFKLLRQAKRLSQQSDGAFDVTWAGMRGVWQFKPENRKVPSAADIQASLKSVGYGDLVLNPANSTVFLKRVGMAIGLGGIAKGYGIDRAAQILRHHGIDQFMVDGGGDLYMSGKKQSGSPWTIGIRHPRDDKKLIAEIEITDGALVTSGDYERSFMHHGRRYHHIIDVRTGYPAQKSVSVTVRAPTATLADALATAIFVLGPQKGAQLAQTLPGVSAAILAPDGTISTTEDWRAKFPARWTP